MDIKDVEKLAELARIELSVDEKKSLLADMQGILEYVKQIEEVQVENVVPEYPIYNIWREDAKEDNSTPREFSKELILAQFPDARDGFLKVKKIL
jgi:aspartyl-tRNA(Asn)/glutamyl-tRNA(Gln) amidotransferase subunit C